MSANVVVIHCNSC